MGFKKNDFLETLGLKYPLIVAPMAGGPSSTELVSAASNAGAMGSIGGAYLSPAALDTFIVKTATQTSKPFGVNLFIPTGAVQVSDATLNSALIKTDVFREELGLEKGSIPTAPFEEDFDQQFEVILRTQPRVFSFVFGVLGSSYLAELEKRDIFAIGTATDLEEARSLEESGVDAIVLQGVEAGGHRGLFNASAADPDIPMLELVKTFAARSKIPIIAAGGIMNSTQIQSALAAGASAVQMGTAFLATKEAGTSEAYRRALLADRKRNTRLTRVFSGRLARGMVNRFMDEMEKDPTAILPFPIQNKFTRDIRAASAHKKSPDHISLWSGSGEGELWTGSTESLIHSLFS